MSPGLLVVLAISAVLLFWVIGAHNRLVVMRNGINDAWLKVQEALDQRGAAALPLVAALRDAMATEQGALDTWLAAHAEAGRAATAMAARPISPPHAQTWVAAETALAAAASRVLALLDQQSELRSSEPVASLATRWRDGQARLPFARQLFNDSAQAYNDAIALIPTRWVARGFGLGRAGLL